MLPFALGGLLGYAGLVVTALVLFLNESMPWWAEDPKPHALELVCVGGLLPWAALCLAADLTARVRRTRAFHSAIHQPWTTGLWGLGASALGIGLGMPIAPFVPEWLPDAVWTSATGAVAGVVVILCMRGTRVGTCASCGYALDSALHSTRCPECGQHAAEVLVR